MLRPTIRSVESALEHALRPGTYITFRAASAFIRDLESVAEKVEQWTIDGHPGQAAGLYELFIAACNEKAEEVDDSGGDLGMFVSTLFDGWMRAREQSGADPAETIGRLVAWYDDDPYAFCFRLERTITKEMLPATLEAFEREARRRIDASVPDDGGPAGYPRRHWIEVLDHILRQAGDVRRYVEFCGEHGELGSEECHVVATMFLAGNDPEEALRWVQRGLSSISRPGSSVTAEYALRELRRDLLVRLGQQDEAISVAWSEFCALPWKHSYANLMKIVPAAARGDWHERAMDEAERSELDSAVELLLELNEFDRLQRLLARSTDERIMQIPAYLKERSAKELRGDHPGLAARLYTLVALRILSEAKSKAYPKAVRLLEAVREIRLATGSVEEWQELLEQIRRAHRRKVGFMADLERMVDGAPEPTRESLMDRARRRSIRAKPPADAPELPASTRKRSVDAPKSPASTRKRPADAPKSPADLSKSAVTPRKPHVARPKHPVRPRRRP